MTDSKDFILISSIKDGNRESFDAFYKKEYRRSVFYVNQYLKNITVSEDIVQESFISLWEKRQYLDPSFPILPYLYSILKNKSLNQLRKFANDSKLKSELLRREYNADIAALSDISSDEVIRFQIEEYINKTFSELPEKISDSFILSRIKGLSYQEIADKKGISVKVVEYHITQAIKIFKEKLKDFLPEKNI